MIRRDPASAAESSYDLIIVGGGIYGVCMTFEATIRGLRTLMLEREDFGGATSWNSLRIIHGGLRYLQSFDLVRFRQSVVERRWFLRHFPDLVRPLRCLMPLYGHGMKRPGILRAALLMNDLLSVDRNRGIRQQNCLQEGQVIDVKQTISAFPQVQQASLKGAAVWWDAAMVSPQRVLMELLRYACSHGATAHNYMNVAGALTERGRIVGVRANDRISGHSHEFAAASVINCAGPWARELSRQFDRDHADLFYPSLAFNVLLDVDPPSENALAVAPKAKGKPMYFLCPVGKQVLAGTVHAPWDGPPNDIDVSDHLIRSFLDHLNESIPGLSVGVTHVKRVYAGLLPTTHAGGCELTKRPIIVDHGKRDGLSGLFSVVGIKYTTSRNVAAQMLKRLGYTRRVMPTERQPSEWPMDLTDTEQCLTVKTPVLKSAIQQLMREEAAMTTDDIIYRRTGWGDDPASGIQMAERVHELVAELEHPSSACEILPIASSN